MKTNLDFEINLLPFISLLAVCISFLLLTAVWVQIGSSELSQALGSSSDQAKEPPRIMAEFSESGSLEMTLKNVTNVPANMRAYSLSPLSNGQFDWKKLENYAALAKSQVPELKTAMILPKESSSYDNIIQIIDGFKRQDITDIGVAPL